MFRKSFPIIFAIAAVAVMLAPAVDVGYASSYTATTTSYGNSISSTYGLITFNDGTDDYSLNDVLKSPFTTTKNVETTITAKYRSGGTLPNQIQLTFSFAYIRYSSGYSNAYFSNVGVIVGDNSEATANVGTSGQNAGKATVNVSLDRAYLETITAADNIPIPITVKVYNSKSTAYNLDSNASVTISVNTGALSHTTISLGGKNVPAKSNNVNGSLSVDKSVIWTYNSLTYSNFNIRYTRINPDVGNGSISLTFTLSKVTSLVNQRMYVHLGSDTKYSTISNTSGETAASVTFDALNLQSGSYESEFYIGVLNTNAATSIGTYTVTITATHSSCTATNISEQDAIVSSDDAVNNMLDSNPEFGTEDSDYNMSTTPAGTHGGNPAVSIYNENNNNHGISDGHGNIDLDFVVPQGASFVIYLTTSGNNTFRIHMERAGQVILDGTVTFNSGYQSMSYYLSSKSYDGSSSGYFYSSLSDVNRYDAWMTGSTAEISVNIYTDDGQSASNNLKMDIVFDSD